ncbi:MAG: adenylate/guanylate cyclase domain-containing protein [Chloroflexota bacterium]
MSKLFQLNVKSKLIFMLLLVSLLAVGIVGYLGWRSFQNTLTGDAFNHLTSVRTVKAKQIEAYFDSIQTQMVMLTENELIVQAMVRFNRGFRLLEREFIAQEWDIAIEEYYENQYFPELSQNIVGMPDFDTYRPVNQAARYLQYHYIAKETSNNTESNNTHSDGNDSDSMASDATQSSNGEANLAAIDQDDSEYTRWHEKYHPQLLNIVDNFGYDDLYLLNMQNGHIVYSVRKRTEFGTSLISGPYRESHLAKVALAVQENPTKGFIQVADFEPYRPALGVPTMFLAGPIYNGPHIVGVLAIQLPTQSIDTLMTDNDSWGAIGLGTTGESYLVGADLRMRSVARPLLTEQDSFFERLRSLGTQSQSIELMRTFNTSTFIQTVNTELAREAVAGQTQAQRSNNYLGDAVLTAAQPLRISGLNWAILTEQAVREVYQPLYRQQRTFLITLALLTLAIVLLAIFLANLFTNPLETLVASTQAAQAGELVNPIVVHSNDEIGQLATNVNGLVEQLQKQVALVDEKVKANEAILHNFFPSHVVERLLQGEELIVDNIPQATVLSAQIRGFSSLSVDRGTQPAIDVLKAIAVGFGEASNRHGMERQPTVDEHYLATCGVTVPRIDHAKRAVEFAEELLAVVKRVNAQHNTELGLRIGIHSGPVTAGVVVGDRFAYKLWGETMHIATHLSGKAGINLVLVSEAVYDRIENLHPFVEYRHIDVEDVGRMKTWALASSLRMPQEQISLVQTTFAQVLPIAEETAQLFYNRLFELDPDLRPLFKEDMRDQQRKLMATLHVVISGLANPEKIIPAARDLGRKHVAYGVRDEHYDLVGAALLWTLGQEIGEDFTPDVQDAWEEMYSRVSSAMKAAAADIEPEELSISDEYERQT